MRKHPVIESAAWATAILIGFGSLGLAQNLALPGNEGLQPPKALRTIPDSRAPLGILGTGNANTNGWCGGPYLDLTAAAGSAVSINGFEMYFQGTVNRNVEVYWKAGSYVGSEVIPGNWTLLGTANVTPGGNGTLTTVAIGGLTIPAGQVYGIKVWDGGTGGTDGPGLDLGSGGTAASDSNLSLVSNHYTCFEPFADLSGSTFGWQGNVLYSTAGTLQELNIDLGSHFGGPADAYGAAFGQSGRWNTVGLGFTPGLVDTSAIATPVSISVTADVDTGWQTGCSGDAEALLADNIFTQNGTWTVTLAGLANGIYEAYLYAPNNGAVATGNMLINGRAVASIPGTGNCDLSGGVSFVQAWVEVTNGTISIMGDSAGSGFSYAGLAGLQLTGPVDPDIFADGFESGDTSAWSLTVP